MKTSYFICLSCLIVSCASSNIHNNYLKYKNDILFKNQFIIAEISQKDKDGLNTLDSTKYYLSEYLKDSSYTNLINNDSSNSFDYIKSRFNPYSFVEFNVNRKDNYEIVFYPSTKDSIVIFNRILEPNEYIFRIDKSSLNYGLYFIKIKNSNYAKIFKRIYGILKN